MSEKIYIKRETANELIYGGEEEGFKWVHSEQVDTRRWESDYLLIIKRLSDNKLFGAIYSEGLTECQGRAPFERYDADENDNIEFVEFKTQEKTITVYVPVEEL